MTIYDIKYRTLGTSPYYFTRSAMKFFGQTMRDFKVKRQPDGRYLITAPTRMNGEIIGTTERYFNPENNKLEMN